MSRAPKGTPPKETSAAATATNISTGIANAYMTNMDEVTADGTRSFENIGSESVYDPYTKMTNVVPRFRVTTTLSDAQQGIKSQNDRASLNMSTLGANLSGKLGTQLTDNFRLGNEATESRLMDLGRKRLDPMFAQKDEALRARLANQGINVGSEAYRREMEGFGQQQNDAYNQLLLNGRGMASNELLTEDNQRINQISALMGGGQVSQPNFQSGVGVNPAPTTDNASIIANSDAQKMQAWQQNQAAMGSMISGVGGLFALSDERAKTDKERIGKTDDGLGIYSFKYKGSDKTEVGLMAQEVKKKKPGAVRKRPDGLMEVNYGRALA